LIIIGIKLIISWEWDLGTALASKKRLMMRYSSLSRIFTELMRKMTMF
jgi:hypothetical protein